MLSSQIRLPLLEWILQKGWPVYTRQVTSPLSCKGRSQIVLNGRNTLFSNQSQVDQALLSWSRFRALTASILSTFGFLLPKYLDEFLSSTLKQPLTLSYLPSTYFVKLAFLLMVNCKFQSRTRKPLRQKRRRVLARDQVRNPIKDPVQVWDQGSLLTRQAMKEIQRTKAEPA